MDNDTLDALAARIDRPDDGARAAARETLGGRGDTSLGRLGEVSVWLAGVSAAKPPAAPDRPRLLVFTADGSVPARTERVTAATGRPPRGERADAGAGDVAEAIARGTALADAEADAGADLLLIAAPAAEATASVVVAAFTGADAPSVVAATGDDAAWMRAVAEIRDGLRRARRAGEDPLDVLAAVGGTEVAHVTGVLLGAAGRRTPVVIEGLLPLAAALVAHRVSAHATEWLLLAHPDTHPAASAATRHLGLAPLLDLGLRGGDGVASALSVPVLAAAAALLAD